MKTKPTGLAVLIVLSALIAACSSTSTISSSYTTKPITVDGKTDERELPLRYATEKGGIQYGISNDNEKLYMVMKITDKQTQMKMLSSGATIWIDTIGKKEKEVTLNYPVRLNESVMRPGKSGERGHAMLQKLLAEQNEMVLNGFKLIEGGELPINNQYGVNVKMNIDQDNALVYELTLPFNTFYKNYQVALKNGKPLTMGVEIEGLSRPEHSEKEEPLMMGKGRSGGGMQGGGIHGGGMRGGGMHGGGMNGGQYSNFEDIAKPIKFDFKLKLAAG
ncbi:hypothetical protein [Solitalea koreensis]|uniref:Uncharacterized protein n=1 Tax=Solitalea koreensis TaxID=543615 RepID=A0A521AF67_9SPHI|nr:hypothetical protein [Solitalea koreensis]SMO33422.1 hypothetical protein SAMN06265350_101100 [Solitalea koreensis]